MSECLLVSGQYTYTAHLEELEWRRPVGVEKVLPNIPDWSVLRGNSA